jgi:hypothetical protein
MMVEGESALGIPAYSITAFLDSIPSESFWNAKKLKKRLKKNKIAESYAIDCWLQEAKAGQIHGYAFDDDGERVIRTYDVDNSTWKRKRNDASLNDIVAPEFGAGIHLPTAADAEAHGGVYDANPELHSYGFDQAVVSGEGHVGAGKLVHAGELDRQQVDQDRRDDQKTKSINPPPAQRRKQSNEEAGEGTWRAQVKRSDIKTGQWSDEEVAKLKEAIMNYASRNGHSTTEYDWIIGKKLSVAEGRGMWHDISGSIPHRSVKAVAAAAVRLFHPYANKGAFSPDEDDALRGLVSAHGNKWTEFSHMLKRTPESCRLRWREIKDQDSRVTGKWSEEEEEQLKSAVEKYGNGRNLGGDTNDKRMLLDNINWEAVVPHVPSRNRIQCLAKWYLRMAPSMHDTGDWGPGDDKRLLKALWRCREEMGPDMLEAQVPWGSLVDERTGDQCKRRWAYLKKEIKDQKQKKLAELIWELVDSWLPKLSRKNSTE